MIFLESNVNRGFSVWNDGNFVAGELVACKIIKIEIFGVFVFKNL
jgi:hypothetical protein